MKKIFSGLAIAALAMGGLLYAGISSSHPQFTEAELSNIDALTQTEASVYDCEGGTTDCVRVLMGNTIHLFYKKPSNLI